LYADVDINEVWIQQAVSNDEDLFGGLVEQCHTNDLHSDSNEMNSVDNDSSSNKFVDKDDRV
jgi:hypothetical protein